MKRRSVRKQGWWWRRGARTRIILSVTSLLLGLVILAIPFSPWILYRVFKPDPAYPYPTKLAGTQFVPTLPDAKETAIPRDNRLVIPKIGVNVQIVEGQDERALSRGIWHLPQTSTPEKGGNTVLTGHRFRYLSGPKTLYLLDQMAVGDVIIVYWKGKEYDYRVRERRIVNPDAVSILNNTAQPQLTVFTCTPVFSTKQRLVLFADPILNT
ncbi:MAG: class E sortase [Candidatus Kerfeldbacteria bacterium]|nr:class E sortase [Candidatus Kerfeldbacteria bacterium]